MLLTPPDVISQSLLALPMWLLFEAGVFAGRILKGRDDTARGVLEAPRGERYTEPPRRNTAMTRYLLALFLLTLLVAGRRAPRKTGPHHHRPMRHRQKPEAAVRDTADAAAQDTNMRTLREMEKQADEVIREKAADLVARGERGRTPLQLIVLLADAIESGDYERGASYLDRALPAR
jgi:hypothetical protein